MCRFLGRRDDEMIHGLWRPASEKRQGTKSREVGQSSDHVMAGEADIKKSET